MSYHLAKFGGHRLSYSRDITGLILHVTLQDHVIKSLYEFMEGSFSLYISTLPNLVAAGIVLVDMILVCHVISQDRVIIKPCDSLGNPS